jgi:hypothetical protein
MAARCAVTTDACEVREAITVAGRRSPVAGVIVPRFAPEPRAD